MPYFVAIHDVSDPERFWGGVAEGIGGMPQGVALHATYPSQDGSKAVCLWEADSVDTVRQIVEGAAGDSSRNEFFEVDPQHAGARGVPQQSAAGT
jgi:hypothetical protein